MTLYALRLTNGADTAPRVRMGDALPLQHEGPLAARSGLRRDGGGAVSAVSGAMQVQVAPFLGWIDGGTSDAQGGYPVVLDAATTLTIDPGDASLTRVDTIAVVIHEDAFDGSGDTSATLQVVKGTPGAGAPTLPDTCLPLRDVNVPAGLSAGSGGLAASNLGADRRTYLSAGIVPVAGSGERDALGALGGQAVYRLDTGKLELFDGTAWASFKKDDGLTVQRGRANITTDGNGRAVVQFPKAFTGLPSVTVGAETSFGWLATLQDSKANQFTVELRNQGGALLTASSCTLHWIAVGA